MAQNNQQPASAVGGFVSLMGGMHAGIRPAILGDAVYSRGINVTSRGGLVRTRPGFTKVSDIGAGVFQGMASWSLHDAQRLIIVLGGVVYVVDTLTETVTSLGLKFPGDRQCYLGDVERYFLIQDGVNPALVLNVVNGAVAVVPTPAFPLGAGFTFAHGRIHMSPMKVPGEDIDGRSFFISGDVMEPADPSACLTFDEGIYLNEGGAHTNPTSMGYLTAFGALRNAATGTGYGGLVVFAERGVMAFDVSISRSLWSTENLGQVLFFGAGTVSPWSVASVNGTLVYRAVDGLRILSYAVSSKQSAGEVLSSVPQSAEVGPYFTKDDADYLSRVSSAVAGDRVFMTVGGSDLFYKALVVLDTARVSEIGSPQTTPSYDGIWQVSGRLFSGITSAWRGTVETLYAVMDDGSLWRLDEDAVTDNGTAISCRLVTKDYFGDMGPTVKRLVGADVTLSDMATDVSIQMLYRPGGYPLWATTPARVFKVGAGSLAQRRRRAMFDLPLSGDGPHDPISGEPLTMANTHQFCLSWTGHCVIQMFRADADLKPEAAASPDPETQGAVLSAGDAGLELGEYLE